jgi:hypothetical protein
MKVKPSLTEVCQPLVFAQTFPRTYEQPGTTVSDRAVRQVLSEVDIGTVLTQVIVCNDDSGDSGETCNS